MKPATSYIAEVLVKAIGVAGAEAMAMRNIILSIWNPLAEDFANELVDSVINLTTGEVREEYADWIMSKHRTKMTSDFVEQVAPYIEEYCGYAWDRGREDVLSDSVSGILSIQKFESDVELVHSREWAEPSLEEIRDICNYYFGMGVTSSAIADRLWNRMESAGLGSAGRELEFWANLENPLLKVEKAQASVISDLVSITGSSKANVQRTIKRWFKDTQGQYFDRFIQPETARLLSYAGEAEGNIASLNKIGRNYKEFVKADGYWSSISEYNAESSKVFAQVQTLHELNVSTYTIVAVLDNKTCDVCLWLNGSTWSVEQAITRVYDMLVMEADQAYEMNPFPGRSAPKDFEDPQESPFTLPPFHPRCRCNVRSEHKITTMSQDVLARPFDLKKPPSDKLLASVFNQFIEVPSKKGFPDIADQFPEGVRALSRAEKTVAKEAWDGLPYELKKWGSRNKENYRLVVADGAEVVSRVEGHDIIINSKYFNTDKWGPEVIQHELRHALVNREVITARGGAEAVWSTIDAVDTKKAFRTPLHVNHIYQVNGGRGIRAASAGADEFLAIIGDYYQKDMSFTELVDAVRHKKYGVRVETKLGSRQIKALSKTRELWTAKEAKNAVEYWWGTMDVDNLTLLTKKQQLAKLSHLPMTSAKRQIAIGNELQLRDWFRAAGIKDVYQEGDNRPFDVWVGSDPDKWYRGKTKRKPKHVIEIKTIISAKNDKITMHKDSLKRKKKELRKFGKKNTKGHTIVFDERTGKYYYRDDLGSFNLSAMEEVTPDELMAKFGGKVGVVEVPPRIATTVEEVLIPIKKPVDWKWEAIPLSDSINDAKAAEAKFAEWMGERNQWLRVDRSDYTAIRPEVRIQFVNEIAEEFTRLQNEYSNLAGIWNEGQSIGTNRIVLHGRNSLRDFSLDGVKAGSGDFSGVSKSYGGFYFKDYYNPIEGWQENLIAIGVDTADELRYRYRSGKAMVSPMKKGTITSGGSLVGVEGTGLQRLQHELGHSLYYSMDSIDFLRDVEGGAPPRYYWNKIYKKLHTTDPESLDGIWKFDVSIYADTNASEAFAESFAMYVHKDYGLRGSPRLPEVVEGFFDDLLGKKRVVEEATETGDLASIRRTSPKVKSTLASKLEVKGTIDEGNVNKVEIVTIGKGKKKYIYKPVSGESFYREDEVKWIFGEVEKVTGKRPTSLYDIKPKEWEKAGFEWYEGIEKDYLMRETIDNLKVSLANREAFALDLGHKLGFNNEYGIVPEFQMVTKKGKVTGILMEYINKAEVDSKYFGRGMYMEERLQMTVYDYIIGNTDRHENNWMRKFKRTEKSGSITAHIGDGRPVYIDHGYSMPGQRRDLGGLAEWRNSAVADEYGVFRGMEQDIFQDVPEFIPEMVERIEKFAFKDNGDLARSYGFSAEEVDAMLRRMDSVVERLRGGTFSDILVKHRENEMWGVVDSYIE